MLAPLLPPALEPAPLLPALREGTRDLHERIERRMDLAAHLASRDGYQTLLQRFYGFYTPLEAKLASRECAAAWTILGVSYLSRRKACLLGADLKALGSATDLSDLPQCPASLLPIPSSAAELIGCAYVMEGATLGGQVIGRILERTLGLRPGEPGAQFFYGYGPRTGAMWQQFRSAAEEFAAGEEAAYPGTGAHVTQMAVAAARRTFAGMEAWLTSESDTFLEQP